jgi:hypothetical protein
MQRMELAEEEFLLRGESSIRNNPRVFKNTE